MSAGDVYRALWRHRVLIVFGTVVVGVAAWYGIARLTPTYEASTLVRVQQPIRADPVGSLQAGQELAQTYAEIIGAGGLDTQIRAALRQRGTTAPASGLGVSASPVQNLALLWISAKSDSPVAAARVANAVPVALRGFVRSSGATDRISVVKRASVPSSPVSPNRVLDLVLAVALGLVFNGALALLVEVFSDRLPDIDDLEETFGYPVLGTIPALDLVALNPASRPLTPGRPPPAGTPGPVEYERKGSIEYVHQGSIEYEMPETEPGEESRVG